MIASARTWLSGGISDALQSEEAITNGSGHATDDVLNRVIGAGLYQVSRQCSMHCDYRCSTGEFLGS